MTTRRSPLTLLWLALLATACATPRFAPDRSLAAAWVELGPDGGAQVRTIGAAAACPSLIVDGTAQPMQVRAGADPLHFPVTVCEASLPAGARIAAVDGRALPVPAPSPRRIVVIGDTGCRMKASDEFQACNDAAVWPFARVAASAAAWRPDLVIHLGDYHYRESPCPAGDAGCAGSPVGDTWPSWSADFFAPAEPLLRAAPWIVVRGNHESCNRAGEGWFRFLEPRPRPSSCTDDTGPYLIPLGSPVLAMIDSSPAPDASAPPAQVARYVAQLDQLAAMTPPYTWLVTHKPVWGVVPVDGQLALGNQTLQAAMKDRLPVALTLLLAGHIHLFEGLAFDPRRPSMLLVGNGGTALDPPITQSIVGLAIDGGKVTTGKTLARFGYVTMEPVAGDWRATVYDVDGGMLAECTVGNGAMICTP